MNRWLGRMMAFVLVVGSLTVAPSTVSDAAGVWTQQALIEDYKTNFGSNFGRSVAVELNTLIAQASVGSYGIGVFQSFDRSPDGSWSAGPDLPRAGRSIDMDDDLVVIGSRGAAWVLTRADATTWSELATLRGGDSESGDFFGYAVAVAGSYIVVGAPGEDEAGIDAGAAYIFRRNTAGVFDQTAKLVAPDGAADGRFGASVAVEPGGRVVVGAPGHDELTYSFDPGHIDLGAAYVSDVDVLGNRLPTAKIVAPVEFLSGNSSTAPTNFGAAVATSDVGLVGIGSGQFAQSPARTVRVYDKETDWALHSQLRPSQPQDTPSFGAALDWEGTLLGIGAPWANSALPSRASGTAYVYEYDETTGTWDETFDATTGLWVGTEIEPAGLDTTDFAGSDVSVDRDTAVVGVPAYDPGSSTRRTGAAFVFVPSDWTYPTDVDLVGPPAPAMGVGPNPAGTFENIALTATVDDSTTGGSIIAGIEYQLNGGAWAPMESLDAGFDEVQETGIVTFSFATEATHEACARGVDEAGNVGAVSCLDIEVGAGDLTPPTVVLTMDPNPVDRLTETSVRVSADDSNSGDSWVVFTEYSIDGGPWTGILSPEDGSYDSPTEVGAAQVSFNAVGAYEICARATDAANNTSEPVCELLNVGDVVPLTVTFTSVELLNTGLDDGATADLYGRVSFLIPGNEIELSNSDDALTMGTGDPQSPYWNFPLNVPRAADPLTVGIALADRDPGEVDDLANITPDAGSNGLTLDIDLSTGTWTGAPLAQGCFAGDSARLCIAVSVRSPNADQDGDGIHDAYELYGYDHDGDGTVDVDFPTLGANVCRPDIAVEIDWMKDHAPLDASIQAAQDSFADAPIAADPTCLDEAGVAPGDGINLIVVRDEEIPTERGIDCERIGELNDEEMAEERRPFFLWNGWIHDIEEEGDTTSGVSCGSGGFVASLGNYSYGGEFGSESRFGVLYGSLVDQIRIEAGTFMHELGHKLGLGHGGADGINYKPNHLSIMSYAFQFFWLIDSSDTSGAPPATLDYSRALARNLNEDDLTEDSFGSDAPYLTLWDDPNDDDRRFIAAPADQPLDWNQNNSTDSGYAQDLNRDGVRDCVTAGSDESLETLLALGTDDVLDTSEVIPRITVGPNGVCDTTAFASDFQRFPVGFDTRLLTTANEWDLLRYPAKKRTFGVDATGAATLFPNLEEHVDADSEDLLAVIEAYAPLVDAAPDAAVDKSTQIVQYSDSISPVLVTVVDSDSIPSLMLDVSAPPWLSLSDGTCAPFDNGFDDGVDGHECIWSLVGEATAPAGSYVVDLVASDGTTDATVSTEIVVVAEDAAVSFIENPVAVEVVEPGGDSGPFTVEIGIAELRPDDPAASAAPGEIGNVSSEDVDVSLVPVGPGSLVSGSCSLEPIVDDGYAGLLPISCEFDGVPVNTYGIEVAVSGDYYRGFGEDVLTVFDTSLGFTTGGGWFLWPETTGKTNFGFTISYNKKGTNVKGSFLLVRHLDDGSTYRIKSNAVEGLSIGAQPDFAWASFVSKATYRDPSMEEPEGNHEITVYVEDSSDDDRLWIEVRNKEGAIIDVMSMAPPAITSAVPISRGNIVVPHPRGSRPNVE